MSSEVKQISGCGVPVIGNDIDTDRIIPARFLRCVTFDGLGEQVFADDRHQAQGQHPFDQAQYQGAKILVVNGNFGCGSSREHAPQAIAKWGIQAIVGESFADIFFGNCIAIGVPCVTAEPAIVKQLQQALGDHPDLQVQIDLTTLQVTWEDSSAPVSLNEGARTMFTTGTWDACGQLLSQAEQIQATRSQLPYMSWA